MKVNYVLEHYPNTCGECPAFRQYPYQCHNERGYEGHCKLGYMRGQDMRDFSGRKLHDKCDIRNNENVKLMEKSDE